MDQSTRNDIIRMFYSRASHRRIAKILGVDRKTVAKVIADHEHARTGTPAKKRQPRKSLLDPFQDNILQLLERYPEIKSGGVTACRGPQLGYLSPGSQHVRTDASYCTARVTRRDTSSH